MLGAEEIFLTSLKQNMVRLQKYFILFEDLSSFFGCFYCPETAVERIEPLWMKLENSICKLIHGVKCYVLSLEQIIDWHLDVAKIVLYLFFKSQLLQLVRQTKIINLVPLALLATKCQNSQELIKSRSNFKAKCRFGSFLHVGLYWIGGRSRPSYLFRKGFLFNGNGFLDSALDGVVRTIRFIG